MRPLLLTLLTACQVRAASELPPEEVAAVDADGDGAALPADCDDDDPATRPGAPEQLADGVDQDCDGREACPADHDGDGRGGSDTVLVPVDAGCEGTPGAAPRRDDCDDDDPDVGPPRTWYVDADADGHGSAARTEEACAPVAGWSAVADDCDDAEPRAHPGAADVPGDGLDADCDGLDPCWRDRDGDGLGGSEVVAGTPEGCGAGALAVGGDCDDADPEVGLRLWHPDLDGDGRGDPATVHIACRGPEAWVADATDCNDGDPSLPRSWFVDADGDGHGDPQRTAEACAPPPGHVGAADDCDDADPAVHPRASERCNGADDDCDGLLDALDPSVADAVATWRDADGDGWGAGPAAPACGAVDGWAPRAGDCDDADPTVSPEGTELPYDDVDQDCDGHDLDDVDGDGHPGGPGGPDCDDDAPSIHPGAREVCGDGIDQDCTPASPACRLPPELPTADSDLRLELLGSWPERLGASLLAAELTGDGVPDVVVGAPEPRSEAGGQGSLYVFDGARLGHGTTRTDAAWARYRGLSSSHFGESLAATPEAIWAGGPTHAAGKGVIARLPRPLSAGIHTSAAYDELFGGLGRRGFGVGLAVHAGTGVALVTEEVGAPLARAWGMDPWVPSAFLDAPSAASTGQAWSMGTATGDVVAVATGPDATGGQATGWALAWVTPAGTTAVRLGPGPPPGFTGELGPGQLVPGSSLVVLQVRSARDRVSLALLPDLTGDLRPDLAVAFACARSACAEPDEVWLIPGPLPLGGLVVVTDDAPEPTRLQAATAGDGQPWAVASAGEVAGHGIPGLLLGAPGLDAGRGRAWLLLGPLPTGTVELARVGVDLPGSRFTASPGTAGLGAAVASLGDLDGDGLDEIALGAPATATPHASGAGEVPEGGAVHIWRGRGE
ncbi:MAG: FG-GAP repeat protein [Alphaproteobacteria bacterium]|nr:FG-GAP repeat protein [Alphaproteobacteria bacterium]